MSDELASLDPGAPASYQEGTAEELGLEGETVFTLTLQRTESGDVFAEVDAKGITKVEAGLYLVRAGQALIQDGSE